MYDCPDHVDHACTFRPCTTPIPSSRLHRPNLAALRTTSSAFFGGGLVVPVPVAALFRLTTCWKLSRPSCHFLSSYQELYIFYSLESSISFGSTRKPICDKLWSVTGRRKVCQEPIEVGRNSRWANCEAADAQLLFRRGIGRLDAGNEVGRRQIEVGRDGGSTRQTMVA